jgi:hypothetical protein
VTRHEGVKKVIGTKNIAILNGLCVKDPSIFENEYIRVDNWRTGGFVEVLVGAAASVGSGFGGVTGHL